MAKILLVDDDIDLVEIVTILLQSKGHQVMNIQSVECVYKTLATSRPDVMLLDIRLQNMDGRKLCKEIKLLQNLSVPIILVSASPELLKDYKSYLADAIIEKPFEIDTLIENVHMVLNKYQTLSNMRLSNT